MGASWFQDSYTGKSLADAYDNAREEAEGMYGHQEGYNGTISTTYGVTDLTVNFKNSKQKIEDYISDQVQRLNKRECAAICVREPVDNKNKTKSQVEHIITPGTKKWVLKYVVQRGDHVIGSWDTKGDAVKDARKYTEKHQVPTSIVMKKYLEKGDNLVANITYKKSTTEKPGRWIFFGWAAE